MIHSNHSDHNPNFGSQESENQKSNSIVGKNIEGNSISFGGFKSQEDHSQEEQSTTKSNVSSRSTTPKPTFHVTQTTSSYYSPSHQKHPQPQQQQHQTPLQQQNHFEPYRDFNRQHKQQRRDSISIQSLIEIDPRSPSTYTNKAQQQSNYYRDHRTQGLGELSTIRRVGEMNFGLASHHIPSPTFGTTGLPRDDGQSSANLMIGQNDQYSHSPRSASSASFHSSNFGHHDNASLLDQDSFAVLSTASKAANFGHSTGSEHGFDPYGTDSGAIGNVSPYDNLSRSSSAFSIHSGLSGSELSNAAHESGTQSDTQILEGQTTHEGMIIGRTRSGTVRRYHSLSSSLSAPQRSEESLSPTGSNFSLRASSDRGSMTSSINVSDSTASSSMSRKKRNKCSPEQFRQLEAFFAKNRNPTGKVREELARSIRMPERSVQVWFQNKRAKTKMNEIKEGIPPELRTTISKPRTGQSSSSSVTSRSLEPDSRIGGGKRSITQTSSSEESVIQLPVVSLCIGAWRRIKPLICLFSRRQQAFTWYLSSESVGFKLECPRSCVTRVLFCGPRAPTVHEFGEGINTQIGYLTVELDRPPQFYMEVFRSSGASPKGKDGVEQESTQQKASWRQCSDFTEGKQATTIFQHVISGPYTELRQAVVQLMETGGALSPMVEMRDEGFGGASGPSNWSESHLGQTSFPGHSGGLQNTVSHMTTAQPSLYTYHPQGAYPMSGAEGTVAAMNHGLMDNGQFSTAHHQTSQWSHAASMPSTWTSTSDFTHGATVQFQPQSQTMTPQGSQHGHLTIHPGSQQNVTGGTPVVTPPSASVLDMNNLRIDTGGLGGGGSAVSNEDGLNQSPYSAAWPRTAAIQPSSSWTQSSTSAQGFIESGISSAPAYGFNSFQHQQQQPPQQQQQQQQQSQDPEQVPSNASALMTHSNSHDGGVQNVGTVNELHQTMFNQTSSVSTNSSSVIATTFNTPSSSNLNSSHSNQSTMDENVMDASLHNITTTGEASNDTLRLHHSALT